MIIIVTHMIFLVLNTCLKTERSTHIGKTSSNAHMRGKEHLASVDSREEGSVMWKNRKERHSSHVPNFFVSWLSV